MPNYATQLALGKEDQRFFINNNEIPGVQNVRAEYANNASLLKYCGISTYKHIPRGMQVGGVSVSQLLLTNDILSNYTGNSGINGYIVKNKENKEYNVAFTSGYLTNYSCSYSFGSLPQCGANFIVFGDIGNISTAETVSDLNLISTGHSSLTLKIPGPGSTTISIDEFSNNRVLAYDLSIAVNRNPIYKIGSRQPVYVQIAPPLEITCNFQVEINDYVLQSLKKYPLQEQVENLSLTVKDFRTEETIQSYVFNNLYLAAEVYETNINGFGAVNVQFKGFA